MTFLPGRHSYTRTLPIHETVWDIIAAMNPADLSISLVERIYRSRSADLVRYLRQRLHSDADARDIAQEAFLRFLRLDSPERLRSPEAYLFRIAANLLWERRLKLQAETGTIIADDVSVSEDTPLDIALANDEAARIAATVEELPPLYRAILMLHIRDGLTFQQIANESGISLSLAKKHYYRALVLCRMQLAGA